MKTDSPPVNTHSAQSSGRLQQQESLVLHWGKTCPHHSFVLSSGLEVLCLAEADLDRHTFAQHPRWWEGRSETCSARQRDKAKSELCMLAYIYNHIGSVLSSLCDSYSICCMKTFLFTQYVIYRPLHLTKFNQLAFTLKVLVFSSWPLNMAWREKQFAFSNIKKI